MNFSEYANTSFNTYNDELTRRICQETDMSPYELGIGEKRRMYEVTLNEVYPDLYPCLSEKVQKQLHQFASTNRLFFDYISLEFPSQEYYNEMLLQCEDLKYAKTRCYNVTRKVARATTPSSSVLPVNLLDPTSRAYNQIFGCRVHVWVNISFPIDKNQGQWMCRDAYLREYAGDEDAGSSHDSQKVGAPLPLEYNDIMGFVTQILRVLSPENA